MFSKIGVGKHLKQDTRSKSYKRKIHKFDIKIKILRNKDKDRHALLEDICSKYNQ